MERKMKVMIKKVISTIFYVALAFIISILLFFISFPIHELGHASFATLSAMALHYPNITLTFSYQTIFNNFSLPQRTATVLPTSYLFTIPFGLAGVFFTSLFYCLIFFYLMLLTKVRNNKKLQNLLAWALSILIIDSIVENLIFGTDGLKLSCNFILLTVISFLFWFMFLFVLSLFLIYYKETSSNIKK